MHLLTICTVQDEKIGLIGFSNFRYHNDWLRSSLEYQLLPDDGLDPVLSFGLHFSIKIHHFLTIIPINQAVRAVFRNLRLLQGYERLVKHHHFAIQDVVPDDHDWCAVLGVVQVSDKLPLEMLLIPALQVPLHLYHEHLLRGGGATFNKKLHIVSLEEVNQAN